MTPEEFAALPYRPCVGAVLRNDAGQVFAAERRGMPGAWQMPQGGMDPGETPAAAALRELEEETSIPPSLVALEAETADWLRYDLPSEIVPTRWGGRFRGQEQKWFLMRFLGQDADIRLETADPEFGAWAWMAPGALLEAIVDFKRPTYEAVLVEFGLVPPRG